MNDILDLAKSTQLKVWKKRHGRYEARFISEGFVRAWLSYENNHRIGGFYISAQLARNLKDALGDKKYVEIYYGVVKQNDVLIVFNFNDESGYIVPPRYHGTIHASALVEFLKLNQLISNQIHIDKNDNKLYVLFER